MHGVKKVLVAVDLEDDNDPSFVAGVMLAEELGVEILLLHVVPEILGDGWTGEVHPDLLKAILDELKGRAESANVAVEDVTILRGKPSYRICQHAEEKSADIVVMGASRKRNTYVQLGTTASRVLRNSLKPMWIAADSSSSPPESILCPVDGSPTSRRALAKAVSLAKSFQAQLTVLKVREDLPDVYASKFGTARPWTDADSRRFESLLKGLVCEYDVTGIMLDIKTREGSAHTEILAEASEKSNDLIVMGAEGTSDYSRSLVGSVTQRVTRAMPCSMLVVCDEDVLTSRLNNALFRISNYMDTGASLLNDGKTMASLAEYEQCLMDEPTCAQAWDGMANVYEAMGDLNKADRCKDSASRIRENLL
ncbi:MAG: universal stress protein [Myxococcota bacterium]|nr:universal stress protein [Myxococcota bacterium]